jgi:hypothetical protein
MKQESAHELQKIQSILDLRCPVHDQAPVRLRGKLAFETCCHVLEVLVQKAEKRIEDN